jgi:hypothetical protein
MPRRFFGTRGSLRDTGLVVTNPHLTARANALDTTPEMFRTVLAESGRGALVRRWCPPLTNSRLHSRLRWSGVISAMGGVDHNSEDGVICRPFSGFQIVPLSP